MQAFARVVELGSFARAADRLDISTSACSRLVADLEAHLDARLLNRTTRSLSLTEAGIAFHERCLQVLSDLEEAESAAHAERARPRGTLRVTCSIHFGLRYISPLLGPFQKAFPDVRLDVSLSDRMVDIVEEGFDLAIRIGESRSTSVVARKLGESRGLVCAAPAYLREYGTPTTPEQLVDHNCLIYEYLGTRSEWHLIDGDGRDRKVRVHGTLMTNNGEMLAGAAAEGLGICYEPDFIVRDFISSGRLIPILTGFTAPATAINAVYPSRRHLSAKVRAFVDHLAAALADTCPVASPVAGSRV